MSAPPPAAPPPRRPPPPPASPSPPPEGSGSAPTLRLIAILVAIGLALMLAAIGISSLSTDSERVAATEATTSSAASSTSAAPTTTVATTTLPPTTTTTRAATTTSTTTPPIPLTVAHWLYVSVFQERDDDGELSGFEIDLVDELTERIGAAANWVETDLTTLYDGTSAGTYDLAVGGLAVLDVILRDVRYSTPYFVQHYALIVNTEHESTVAGFDTLTAANTVAVLRSTRAVEWAEVNLAPIGVRVVEFDSPGEAIDALRSGEADALISAALYPLAAAGRLEPLRLIDATATGSVVAFAVDPAQPDLLAQVNEALGAMADDGTYQQIYDRWFEDGAGSVAAPQT